MSCKIIEKQIEKFQIRLFEEEIDVVQALCFLYNLSYEQLFVKLSKEHAEKLFIEEWKLIEKIENYRNLLKKLTDPREKEMVENQINEIETQFGGMNKKCQIK